VSGAVHRGKDGGSLTKVKEQRGPGGCVHGGLLRLGGALATAPPPMARSSSRTRARRESAPTQHLYGGCRSLAPVECCTHCSRRTGCLPCWPTATWSPRLSRTVPFHERGGPQVAVGGVHWSRFHCCPSCVCQRAPRRPRRPRAPPDSAVRETRSSGRISAPTRRDLVVWRNGKQLLSRGLALIARGRPTMCDSPLGGGGDPRVISGRNSSVRSIGPFVEPVLTAPAITWNARPTMGDVCVR